MIAAEMIRTPRSYAEKNGGSAELELARAQQLRLTLMIKPCIPLFPASPGDSRASASDARMHILQLSPLLASASRLQGALGWAPFEGHSLGLRVHLIRRYSRAGVCCEGPCGAVSEADRPSSQNRCCEVWHATGEQMPEQQIHGSCARTLAAQQLPRCLVGTAAHDDPR